jgi:Cu2+-exporting ATPase
MEQYHVTGMTCAACSARVEKAVSALNGVDSCTVNLLTNSMVVSGSVTSAQVIAAVEKAGYGASLKGEKRRFSRAQGCDPHPFSPASRNPRPAKVRRGSKPFSPPPPFLWDFV